MLFLRKEREPACKQFDDEDWLPFAGGGGDEPDTPLSDVQEASVASAAADAGATPDTAGDQPPKVRPIQMDEFLRKNVSRRLHAPSARDIVQFTNEARQLGVGTPGEALAILTGI